MNGTGKRATAYDDAFYERYVEGMASSAARVLGVVYSFYQPASVLDLGCGRGAWLAAAGALGATIRYGLDGPWIAPQDLLDPGITFRGVDFAQPLPALSRRFELAMSVEVAEHVPAQNADGFVDVLCAASDVVLFGAAIPRQGGDLHVNEQPQSYWAGKFAVRGYECHDVIRPALWHDEAVRWWYRQNTFLFVREGSAAVDLRVLRAAVRPLFDVVHPALFEKRAAKAERLDVPDFADCSRVVRRYLRGLGRRALGSGERRK